MIKCLNGGCPKGKEICCTECDEIETCEAACDSDPVTCGDSAILMKPQYEGVKK